MSSRSRNPCRCPSGVEEENSDCFHNYVQRSLYFITIVVGIMVGVLLYIFKVLYDRSLLVSPIPSGSFASLSDRFLPKRDKAKDNRKISFVTDENSATCLEGQAESADRSTKLEKVRSKQDCNIKSSQSACDLEGQSPSNATMDEQFLKNVGYPNQSEGTMNTSCPTLIKKPVKTLPSQCPKPKPAKTCCADKMKRKRINQTSSYNWTFSDEDFE